ncbi:MAG: hypothetical protein V8T07_01160 [Muribaculaceae bacterium]
MSKKKRWLRNTPWAIALAYVRKNKRTYCRISEDEMLFGLLCWNGMPKNLAYSLAFPQSRATEASTAQQASRLFNSWEMHRFLSELEDSENRIAFRYQKDVEAERHPYG